MKVSFKTLGCKVNQAETQGMMRALSSEGITISDDDPDVVIVNTCTVTAEADRKSRKTIRHLIKGNANTRVIVTGCYARMAAEELKSIPGVYLVDTAPDKEDLTNVILSEAKNLCVDPSSAASGGLLRMTPSNRMRPFIKIQNGCDNHCSYCVVPTARGSSRSKPAKQVINEIRVILSEAKNLRVDPSSAASGGLLRMTTSPEIVLTGVNLGKYQDGKTGLTQLLKQILDTPGLGRVRLSSIEPEDVKDDLIELISDRFGNSQYVCRHLHIPLQSGDDMILGAMGRRYTSTDYRELIKKTKESISGIAVTTDVIVGFPGETAEQFEDTCELVSELGLARLHVFVYSPRPGTPAASLPGRLPKNELNRRSEVLRNIGKRLEQDFKAEQVAKKHDLVIEQGSDGKLRGLTDNYLRVDIESELL